MFRIISRDSIPKGAKILFVKNIYKKKKDPDNKIIKYKIKFIIKGFK